jgi:hypothetical protein
MSGIAAVETATGKIAAESAGRKPPRTFPHNNRFENQQIKINVAP